MRVTINAVVWHRQMKTALSASKDGYYQRRVARSERKAGHKYSCMKIRDFIKKRIEVDVYDDVTEDLAMEYCGPLKLTEAGEKEFADVLDFEIEEYVRSAIVIVSDTDGVWQEKLKRAIIFFNAADGNCSETEYKRWFK